ncbi:MAG: hypothetical protein ACKVTZ_16245 [Bacteroidia bacterium]
MNHTLRTYWFFILAVLVGCLGFAQKFNKHNFYDRYFRVIAEISDRNSQHFAAPLPTDVAFSSSIFVEVEKITPSVVMPEFSLPLFLLGHSVTSQVEISQTYTPHFQRFLPEIQFLLEQKKRKMLPLIHAPC